jgi:hypothetical protein
MKLRVLRYSVSLCAIALVGACGSSSGDVSGSGIASGTHSTVRTHATSAPVFPTSSASSPSAVASEPLKGAAAIRGDLVFQRGKSLYRISSSGTAEPIRVVANGGGGIGTAASRHYVFWIAESSKPTSVAESIKRANLNGAHVVTLVGHIGDGTSAVVVGRYLYWTNDKAIGRVALNGSRLDRRFITVPQEAGGGIADGMASDSKHLYLARCDSNRIVRVPLTRSAVIRQPRVVVRTPCPLSVTVSERFLYWTADSSRIGRARLGGGGSNAGWVNTHSSSGPDYVAAVGKYVYWEAGGSHKDPSHIGRVRTNRSGLTLNLFAGDGPLAIIPR